MTTARSAGFTLIELLIVMIIVSVLAGIAIPVFLNQRGKAVDTDLKGDVRNVAAALESHYAGAQQYAAAAQSGRTVTVGAESATVSSGTTVTVTALADDTTATATWAWLTRGLTRPAQRADRRRRSPRPGARPAVRRTGVGSPGR